MSNHWIVLAPLLPFLAAVAVGLPAFFNAWQGRRGEQITAGISCMAISLAALLLLALLVSNRPGEMHSFGRWLHSGSLNIDFNLSSAPLNLGIAALFGLLLVIVMRFAVNYMHREPGFQRFFFILNLFAAAMLLLVLSGNALFSFVGWELAGVCSYGLIAYAYDRPIAAHNATRVFITNRIGDAGFLLGLALSAYWVESLDWRDINRAAADLDRADAHLLALCFTLAAFAKSAQIPFTPWLARAVEGPTPSSAVFYGGVMIHAGVFLLIQLQELLSQAPLVMVLLVIVGALTALYSFVVGLTQTDIKSSQIFAASAQLGLMFVECGLGFWQWATWHLVAHAVVRCYLLLTSPSILHNTHDIPLKPVTPLLANARWAFIAALQRGWLEPALDWLLVKPILNLARDARYLDEHIIEPALGVPAPALRAMSALAQSEERKMGANLDSGVDSFAQGSGLAGKLAGWTARLLDWFEYHFILRGIGKNAIHWGRHLGHAANRFEQLLLRPRYLLLFVLITLLVALKP